MQALETLTKLKNISIANRMVSSMLPNVSRSVRSRDFFNVRHNCYVLLLQMRIVVDVLCISLITSIQQFEENDYRVFFINAYSDVARIVICEVQILLVYYSQE